MNANTKEEGRKQWGLGGRGGNDAFTSETIFTNTNNGRRGKGESNNESTNATRKTRAIHIPQSPPMITKVTVEPKKGETKEQKTMKSETVQRTHICERQHQRGRQKVAGAWRRRWQ